MVVQLTPQLTCINSLDGKISPSSITNITVTKKLPNLYIGTDNMYGYVYRQAQIYNNQIYTLNNEYLCKIDLNTFSLVTLSSSTILSNNTPGMLYLNVNQNNADFFLFTDEGYEAYNIVNKTHINDNSLSIYEITKIFNSDEFGIINGSTPSGDGQFLYNFHTKQTIVKIQDPLYVIYSFLYNNIIYIIQMNSDTQYIELHYVDQNNNIVKIRDYPTIDTSTSSIIFNIKDHIYLLSSGINVNKIYIDTDIVDTVNTNIQFDFDISYLPDIYFNLQTNDKVTFIPFLNNNDGSYNIFSIDYNDNIILKHFPDNIAQYVGTNNNTVPVTYLDDTIFYIILSKVNYDSNTAQNYLQQYDKELKLLFETEVCGPVSQILKHNNKIYVLTTYI